MAIFRLEAKVIARKGKNNSVVAASAYRAGTKLRDERKNKPHDYRTRQKGIVYSRLLAPQNALAWMRAPESLWNGVEAGESRKDAQLAREFVLAIPPELALKEQIELIIGWVQNSLVNRGMIAEICIHRPASGTNPHAHVLCTLRNIEENGFGKKNREWNDLKLLYLHRKSWEEAINTSLEKAGFSERVDCRSLKERGIARIPQPKIGRAAWAMKNRGVPSDRYRMFLESITKNYSKNPSSGS